MSTNSLGKRNLRRGHIKTREITMWWSHGRLLQREQKVQRPCGNTEYSMLEKLQGQHAESQGLTVRLAGEEFGEAVGRCWRASQALARSLDFIVEIFFSSTLLKLNPTTSWLPQIFILCLITIHCCQRQHSHSRQTVKISHHSPHGTLGHKSISLSQQPTKFSKWQCWNPPQSI